MDTGFTPLGKTAVERHRLRFDTQKSFAEACRRCREEGFLTFSAGESGILVGRLVRIHRKKRVIEVDAARDFDSQPVTVVTGKRRRARNALAAACVPLADIPARLREIWGIKQGQ